MTTLSKEERDRFAHYCIETARSNRLLLEQMTLVRAPHEMVDRYARETDAFEIVAGVLLATEEGC